MKTKVLTAIATALAAIAACFRAFFRFLAAKLTDIVGLLGLATAGRGIWLEFGQSWALMIVGGFLVALSVLSVLRGNA